MSGDAGIDQLSELHRLAGLDFTGRAEAFVEARFLTPLLECLGYETHKDYEVHRHGDDGASFKLHYPPVEKGAQRVKHYNPDYVPTIRKKAFWIIEAKSPKDVAHPFDPKYLVQGMQYCIHPEVQAKYLVLTNGRHTDVYDVHGSVFLDKELFSPILSFRADEIPARWPEIYNLLAVERIRDRIEGDIKSMYDKLCLSSLDPAYPQRLLRDIGASAGEHSLTIKRHVNRLFIDAMDRDRAAYHTMLEASSAAELYDLMDFPLQAGPRSVAHYYVTKRLQEGASADQLFSALVKDFEVLPIFRKLQSWVGLCALYRRTDRAEIHDACHAFFDCHKDADLPVLNQVECGMLRLTRKIFVISIYPQLREKLNKSLETAPELVRFVRPPTALALTYQRELEINRRAFAQLRVLPDGELQKLLPLIDAMEEGLATDYATARARTPDAEREMGGFETYGIGGKHYAFKNILINCGLDKRPS